ncbi:MAG: type II toxin-antitoxin system HipA family toxin [Labilithrix sp.]|nr:type II toxin-antitoxin system HipA family toxin [Labilithrix sp.]
MPAGKCHLELYIDGDWTVAAEVRCDDVSGGFQSSARLEYDFDYLATAAELDVRDRRAVSCRYPVGYGVHAEEVWPAFLLDLVPSGAARRFWEAELGVPNTEASDWAVLVAGGGNPPGNLRVREAAQPLDREAASAPGFPRADVLDRAEGFIEYARKEGASIAGGSGAAGDAPKFLLREDDRGRWHADGAVSDARTARSWIVKFPRSGRPADRLVLETEAAWYRLAGRLGARVAGPLSWERDSLFVPRFDRPRSADGRIARLGMESLCSLAGVSDFGAPIAKEALAAALARFATDPARELRELLLRDVLDVALGNTDNHARNSAVLKHEDGGIELTPLYDFAPMVLDPQGIARVCRWRDETDGYPDWGRVAETLDSLGLDAGATKSWLRELSPAVAELPRLMIDEGVGGRVREILEPRIARVARALEAAR